MATQELRRSDNPQWVEAGEHVAGKWQIPALGLALVALGLSIATYRSPVSRIPFEDLRDKQSVLVEKGMYTAAIGVAEQLFLAPDKTAQELAPVYANLARARLKRAERSGARVASVGRAVLEHFGAAVDGGFKLTAEDQELLGKAHEWAGEFKKAIAYYDAAIQLEPAASLDLRWHVATLRTEHAHISAEHAQAELKGLIAAASGRPDVLTWAVEHEIDLLCDEKRCDQTQDLLARTRPQFGEGPWGQWFAYLEAYALYRSGEVDEAEMRLRHLRDDLGTHEELYARTGWLLGRLALGLDRQQRPEEALSFFHDVVSLTSAPSYAMAANLGIAEASVMLERFETAADRYAEVISSVGRLPANRHVNPRVIEASLTVVSDRLRREGRLEPALKFARLAAEVGADDLAPRRAMLLDRLSELLALVGRAKRAAADALGESQGMQSVGVGGLRSEAHALFLESAEVSDRVADMASLKEGRRAAAAWSAAEHVRESGDLEATIKAMDRFMRLRPSSSYVVRALRYRGQAQQLLNRYGDAVETYREALRRFPRTPDAGSSLIPLARCYLALGKKYGDLAEKTLRAILNDSDVFTPQAPEYADALFLLGDLLNRNGAFERAIPSLEEAMERYPDDARTVRARFLLGDCYRQSGLALKEDYAKATFAAERERIAVDQKDRLRKAAELFALTVADFESAGGERSVRDAVYLRDARLYEADCRFELGEYDAALGLYERAAWIYKGTTTALAAYVQIVNCHVFAGDRAEAAAAVRRALYLVETMPEEMFTGGAEFETRSDWRDYFAWVQQTELF